MQEQLMQAQTLQYQEMLNNYADIIEKTNTQLGHGISVSNLAVAVLSCLIAVIAIGVAWFLWKNSKDQKDMQKDFLEGLKVEIDEQNRILMEEKAIEIDKQREEVTTLIESLKKIKEEQDTNTVEQKQKIKSVDHLIKKYQQIKEGLDNPENGLSPRERYIRSLSQRYGSSTKRGRTSLGRCSNCNKYSVRSLGEPIPTSDNSWYCPFCNTRNVSI